MSKQIFIEVIPGKEEEKTYVDWNKEFHSIGEVIVTLQVAMGAAMQQMQGAVEMQQKGVARPPFAKRGMY